MPTNLKMSMLNSNPKCFMDHITKRISIKNREKIDMWKMGTINLTGKTLLQTTIGKQHLMQLE